MADIHIKAGDSLILSFQMLNSDGSDFVIVPGMSVTASLVDIDGNLVADLPLTQPAGTVGLVTTEIDDTGGWPLGQLRCDLVIVLNGAVSSSESFAVYVDQPITVRP